VGDIATIVVVRGDNDKANGEEGGNVKREKRKRGVGGVGLY
jgi:hypothetical protein